MIKELIICGITKILLNLLLLTSKNVLKVTKKERNTIITLFFFE